MKRCSGSQPNLKDNQVCLVILLFRISNRWFQKSEAKKISQSNNSMNTNG